MDSVVKKEVKSGFQIIESTFRLISLKRKREGMNQILINNEQILLESLPCEELNLKSDNIEELTILRNMKLYLLMDSVRKKEKRRSWKKWIKF